MKTILIYGDSNTWGATAHGKRYPYGQQWAWILQRKLGDNHKVIQEGLCGRFAGDFYYDLYPCCSGQYCYEPIYRSASPVDIVVIALGTNDLNGKYNRTPDEIVTDILWYETKTKVLLENDETMPVFIYVLPLNFIDTYDEDEISNSGKREVVNEELKRKVGHFVEMNNVDLSSDGLHFSPKGHEQVADIVYEKVKETVAFT